MKTIDILLVEDNEGDIVLTIDALEECKIINQVTVKRDGWEAINYFETAAEGQPLPDIVLLDINLPKVSGHEVLMHIKANERLKHIPVIMLTTSSSDKDIMMSYKNHVNCFITKPIEIGDFIKAMAKIEDFWINIVSIPRN